MSGRPRLGSRTVLGAIAGVAGTTAMTMVMGRLHRRLPIGERYPLPPREIIETVFEVQSDEGIKDLTTTAHFAYGAASGALLAAAAPAIGPFKGAVAGIAIWAASYFGWIPLFRILSPVHRHPVRRNAVMIGAHLAWGAVTAAALRELILARSTMLRPGPLRDR